MDQQLLEHTRSLAMITSWHIQMTIPSILAEGESFAMRMTVFGPDALPRSDFPYVLSFEDCQGIEGLPRRFAFDPDSEGMVTIEGLTATTGQVARVRARILDTPMYGGDPIVLSTPAWIFADPKYRIFWGDIHVHTQYSECGPWRSKPPEVCYQYARDISHLDFAGIADHTRGIMRSPDRWDDLQELVKKYDQPGRFVPILGYESSHAKGFGGDNNVYFAGMEGPLFWLDRDDMKGIKPTVHLRELWAYLDKAGKAYMTIPHHTARKLKNRTFDEPYYDAQREPLFELYSSWGSSEMRHNRFPLSGGNSEEKAYYVDALKSGCRYGVMCSSDDHETLPGGQHRHRGMPFMLKTLSGYHHQGLTAIRTGELNRERLWHAMKNRSTYGTTLSRTLVDLRIGDLSMGQEAQVGSSDPLYKKRIIHVSLTQAMVGQTTITLMRNGEEYDSATIQSERNRDVITFVDDTSLCDCCIRESRFHSNPFVVYYARIQNAADHTQWTSPIWLDV